HRVAQLVAVPAHQLLVEVLHREVPGARGKARASATARAPALAAATLCQSADRINPRSHPPHSERIAAGSSAPTCPAARRLPRPSAGGVCTAQTLPQNATQKPPIASLSAASAALQNRQRTW